MQKQKELAMEQRSTGQPRDLIAEADLEKMGGELLRHCDNMEKHGLVDYQMGVWEEQILDGKFRICTRFTQAQNPTM